MQEIRNRKGGGNVEAKSAAESHAVGAAASTVAPGKGGGSSVRRLLKILALVATTIVAASAVLLMKYDLHRAEHLKLPEQLRPFRPVPIRILNALNVAAATFGTYRTLPTTAPALPHFFLTTKTLYLGDNSI